MKVAYVASPFCMSIRNENWKYNVCKKITQLTKVVFRLHCEVLDKNDRLCRIQKNCDLEIANINNLCEIGLKEAKEAYEKYQDEIKKEYDQKFNEYKLKNDEKQNELFIKTDKYKTEINQLKANIEKLIKIFEDEINKVINKSNQEIVNRSKDYRKEINKYKSSIEQMKADFNLKINSLKKCKFYVVFLIF